MNKHPQWPIPLLQRLFWLSYREWTGGVKSQSGGVVAEVLVREVAIRTKRGQENGKNEEMWLADEVCLATQEKEDPTVTSRLQPWTFGWPEMACIDTNKIRQWETDLGGRIGWLKSRIPFNALLMDWFCRFILSEVTISRNSFTNNLIVDLVWAMKYLLYKMRLQNWIV